MPELNISYLTASAVIFFFTLITHGLVLFNDGVYWDGWLLRSWQQRGDFAVMRRFYDEVGMPFLFYAHRFMGKLPHFIFCYKVLSFICFFLSSLLVYLICQTTGFLTDAESLCIALLMLCYPGQQVSIDLCIILQYMFPLVLFFLAGLLGLKAETMGGMAHWTMRIGAIIFFLISFNMNSLLVFYFGFISLLVLGHIRDNGFGAFGIVQYIMTHIDYFLIPFLFWFWKKKYTPRHGYYADYNRINLNISKIKNGFIQLIRTGAVGILITPVIFLLRRPVVLMIALIVFLFFVRQSISFDAMLQTKAALLFLYGSLLLILGSLPYILVGQPFGLRGWSTRNNILLALPLALIILGLCSLFLKTSVIVPFLIFLLIVFIIYLNYIYLCWIALWAKYRSMLFNLKKIPSAKDISIFGFCDQHPISGTYDVHAEHGTIHLVYMFAYIWGDISRLGIPEVKPRINGYTQQEILSAIKETTLDYALNRIDPLGKQAMLIVRQGEKGLSEIQTAIYYLIHRFIRKDKMDQYLAGITEVELISLDVPA